MQYFRVPEVIFGQDALSRLHELNGKSAFIVTDKNMMKLGFVDKVKERLSLAGIKSNIFDEVEPEPSFETVKKGATLMRQHAPDWVVALGGGSVMDAAKAMRVEYERPDIKLEEIYPFMPDLGLGVKTKLICIPTTSGTGSEVTSVAVLTDSVHQKQVVPNNRELMPDIAIVDPQFATAMPPEITAMTGIDVLTHAIEGFTSTRKNDFSDGLCLRAIQLVFQYLPRAYRNGQDMEAREKMHNASTIAGIGFINSLVAMAHAAGTSLGAAFHVPHGRVVGLLLPYTIEFIGEAREGLWVEIAHAINVEVPEGKKAALVLAQAIRGLARSIKEPLSLKEIDISSDNFNNSLKKLVDDTMADFLLNFTFRLPSTEETERFFRYTYEGKSIDF